MVNISELKAIESAYTTLATLDRAGRRRALRWLTDALGAEEAVTDVPRQAELPPVEIVTPARRAAQAVTTSGASGRVYRRMPDPQEIVAAYREVGTIGGLAVRFDVPRHTVNHWVRRLRQQGMTLNG